MDYSLRVAFRQAQQDVLQVALDPRQGQLGLAEFVQGHLEVLLEVFEDQVDLFVVDHYVLQAHHVLAGYFPQQADLAQGGARDALFLDLELYLLYCHQLLGLDVHALEDDAVGAFADGLDLFVPG